MQRARIIVCWIAVALIASLLLKPWFLQIRHLQFYSPWQESSDDIKRYLKIVVLIPFTLFGTLIGRRGGTRFMIVVLTLGIPIAIVAYLSDRIDRDPSYLNRNVRELFQNNDDASEKIILQTENKSVENPAPVSAVLRVKPYSRELQEVHAADTNHLDPSKWKRLLQQVPAQ